MATTTNIVEIEPTEEATNPATPATAEGAADDNETTTLGAYEGSGFSGDYGVDDVEKGFLALVSGSSNLAESFLAGQFVASKEIDLGKECEVIFLKCDKRFEEASTTDQMLDDPRSWATLDEAKASGAPYYAVGNLTLVVRVPEDSEHADKCWFVHGGFAYLPQGYTVRGSKSNAHGGGYGTIVKRLFRDAEKGCLKDTGLGCAGGVYKLYRTKESYNGNDYFRARISFVEHVSPELRELILDETGL